jgi:hypothetical protein
VKIEFENNIFSIELSIQFRGLVSYFDSGAISIRQESISIWQESISIQLGVYFDFSQESISIWQESISICQESISICQGSISICQESISICQESISICQEAISICQGLREHFDTSTSSVTASSMTTSATE